MGTGLGKQVCGSTSVRRAQQDASEASSRAAALKQDVESLESLIKRVKKDEDEAEEKQQSAKAMAWNGCSVCGICCALPGLVGCWVFYVTVVCIMSGYFEGRGWCVENLTQGLADKYGAHFIVKQPGKHQSGNMTASPDYAKWHSLKSAHLTDLFVGRTGAKYGYASAGVMPEVLYHGSKAAGVFENIPRKLRGIFWMDGNPLPEVLASFQYGRYFENEKILLSPKVPYAWAFWGEDHVIPNYKPNCGSVLTDVCHGTPAQYDVNGRDMAQSYTAGIEDLWTMKIDSDLEQGNFYARMQMNWEGDLGKRWAQVPPEGIPQDYTFEEVNDGEGPPGTKFHRGVYMGCGHVPPWRFGYKAKKIIDEHGNKVQPWFGQYMNFMQNHRLIVMWEADGW